MSLGPDLIQVSRVEHERALLRLVPARLVGPREGAAGTVGLAQVFTRLRVLCFPHKRVVVVTEPNAWNERRTVANCRQRRLLGLGW